MDEPCLIQIYQWDLTSTWHNHIQVSIAYIRSVCSSLFWRISLLDRDWGSENKSHSNIYDQHVKNELVTKIMNLSYIQKRPNKLIAYSNFCHFPQRQPGQGDKNTHKKSSSSQRAVKPAMQQGQPGCQQITARGSAKKDELMKFPTSSLFRDLYWKVILCWTSWTLSQG